MSQSKRKRHRGGQPGPRPLRLSEILVSDPRGDRRTIHQRPYREALPGTDRVRKLVVYELSSGERLQMLDKDTFVSPRTGAKYVRISD